jgi:hypothetical protein
MPKRNDNLKDNPFIKVAPTEKIYYLIELS